MGLGSYNLISLAEARISAFENRKLIFAGIDPIENRSKLSKEKDQLIKRQVTFDECCQRYIDSHRRSWRNPKHIQQWENTLRRYVSPSIGHLAIADVGISEVMSVLEPIWWTKTVTASRVRSRMELIIAWATVNEFRSGNNSALWRNNLDKLLPKRSRISKETHFAALPFQNIGEFYAKLKLESGIGARALEFLILTATRTSEVIHASWNEINFEESLWVIPAARMKAGIEHRVPLSSHSLGVLSFMSGLRKSNFIFPGFRQEQPLSNNTLLKVLERMNFNVTVHGFRSTFRDWSAERTNFPNEVCEQALAHTLRDKVESAYRRGDLLLKRRVLMEKWADFCATKSSADSPVLDFGQLAT